MPTPHLHMDAHPDYTITRSATARSSGRARFGSAAASELAPVQADRRPQGRAGHFIGGHLAYAQNDQIADFSLVQYVGTQPNPKQDVKLAH